MAAANFPLYIYHSPLAVHQGVVYLQPSEARVRAGATVPLLAAHNGAEMAFTLEEDKLTRKGSDCELLPHPRFDPRWEGARVNLDDQWKQIMQSMARNPKECAAMQEAVMPTIRNFNRIWYRRKGWKSAPSNALLRSSW